MTGNFRLWFTNSTGDSLTRETNSLYEAKREMVSFIEEAKEKFSQSGSQFYIHDFNYNLFSEPKLNKNGEIIGWEIKK